MALLQELSHVEWLDGEEVIWSALDQHSKKRIRHHYDTRKKGIEIELGLRLPPFAKHELAEAHRQLFLSKALLERVEQWIKAGYVDSSSSQTFIEETQESIAIILERLDAPSSSSHPISEKNQLNLIQSLFEATDRLHRLNAFVSQKTEKTVRAALLAEQTQLEIKLGLRVQPQPEPLVPKSTESQSGTLAPSPVRNEETPENESFVATQPLEPVVPRIPLRDRIWQALLSERTLQGMLFLGIFLLFAAALSFVVWGWKDFSAPLRVAIPTSFTAFCFAIGWYVRTKTPMYRSGIALSAIAALLVPIDFYTIYVNFRFSPDAWPTFWLITSLASLLVYIISTYLIRSRFFGYLVGTAAGSTVLALIQVGHQLFGLSLDWRSAGLSTLALLLTIVGTRLTDSSPQATKSVRNVFSVSFGYLSLLAMGVILPLTFGWRYLQRDGFDTLHLALVINWWLGCCIFGWGAITHRSRSLGIITAGALPVSLYLTQDYVFHRFGINSTWQAFGWAWLIPVYFIIAKKLERLSHDVYQYHRQTAIRSGVILLGITAVWPLVQINTHTLPAAATHALLAASVLLAALLWQKPSLLYGASAFAFSAMTFAMTATGLDIAQLSVGWATLAIAHILLALRFGTRVPTKTFATPVVTAGYGIAALSILPPLFPLDNGLLTYALSNWILLTGWGAWLAYRHYSGFEWFNRKDKPLFHWFAAPILPLWLWIFSRNFDLPANVLPLALALLTWLMLGLSYRLKQIEPVYQWPWYLVGLFVSIVAPIVAFIHAPADYAPALTLLLSGSLYFLDAYLNRHSKALAVGGLITFWGYLLLLEQLALPTGAINIGATLLIGCYLAFGFILERKKGDLYSHYFLRPLYGASHVLTLYILLRIYQPIFIDQLLHGSPWTTERGLWGATTHYLLAAIYGMWAIQTHRERWGHGAIWLFALGSSFIAITLSTGSGASAVGFALLAMALPLTERGLNRLRQHPPLPRRNRALIRIIWSLYRRPLLIAGWSISAVTIGIALLRNLLWLGGSHSQQIWATIALLMITALYAVSARLFRRPLFVWLSAALIFAPWTILTHLGWLTPYRPTLPAYGLSWLILAGFMVFTAQLLITKKLDAYALPLKVVAHMLTPFSLLWAAFDIEIACLTIGLAIGFYTFAARQDHLKLPIGASRSTIIWRTKFIYPIAGLVPIWSIYITAWLLPSASLELYGLLLIVFGPLGLIAGRWLRHQARYEQAALAYAFPAYWVTYTTLVIGTLLVIGEPALLALVILFDAMMMIVSARLFKHPVWLYIATILTTLSLYLALQESSWSFNRFGWWLIGLASIYLMLAWCLKRIRLDRYSRPLLQMGLVLTLVSLIPSSLDETGAMWGYGGAALLYTIAAFWLRQPPFLSLACGFSVVPYVVLLHNSPLTADYYGLALFPPAVLALIAGNWLDRKFGSIQSFPWSKPEQWLSAIFLRIRTWWALPVYGLGLGLTTVAPFYCEFRSGVMAITFIAQMVIFGWALYRFRFIVWLIAIAIAGHCAAFFALASVEWWQQSNPAQAWLGFLPVVVLTLLVAIIFDGYGRRSSHDYKSWAQILYTLALLDIAFGQWVSFNATLPGVFVSLSHTALLGTMASIRLSRTLTYVSLFAGLLAVGQSVMAWSKPIETMPIVFAQLAFVYGVIGYGLTYIRKHRRFSPKWISRIALWELPCQHSGLFLSFGTLVFTGWLGIDLIGWTVGALLGLPFRSLVEIPVVQMTIGVFGFLGLLYVATAFTYRQMRLGYGAIAMLLAAWMLHVFYLQRWDSFRHVQWYAMPAGLYLVSVAYLEWHQGNKNFARWLDYSATLLMLGSLFWQTLLFGWIFALLLGTEGLAAFFWGSFRRLRRFLYTGMVGMILATIGQLLNSLRSINQWIVFGLIGLLLISIAVIVERKLEQIKTWHEVLETWE
ncbi:MAG: hypothetical protein KDJ52_05015 [Anaerolineae bacterium]|nr:hypothetical protein [Anaerolineae bacterium]